MVSRTLRKGKNLKNESPAQHTIWIHRQKMRKNLLKILRKDILMVIKRISKTKQEKN